MEIKQSSFVKSAVAREQYPTDGKIEIAFVGRSNVGKSSLINSLTNRRKLVKVSGTPGKTRLINFFLINNDFYFVDLPGYGYAKVSKVEKESWKKVVETYLTGRRELKKIILLVDSRREPTQLDITMHEWVKHYGYEYTIVATKSDKLTRNERQKSEKIIKDTLKMNENEKLIYFSSLNKSGREELLDNLFETVKMYNSGEMILDGHR